MMAACSQVFFRRFELHVRVLLLLKRAALLYGLNRFICVHLIFIGGAWSGFRGRNGVDSVLFVV